MTKIERKPQRGIVAAACQVNGLTLSMPAPARHCDILWSMESLIDEKNEEVQGFLDHRGVFLGREAALIVALQWGQISKDEFEGSKALFSEHLW
jgi:hypothetical protein